MTRHPMKALWLAVAVMLAAAPVGWGAKPPKRVTLTAVAAPAAPDPFSILNATYGPGAVAAGIVGEAGASPISAAGVAFTWAAERASFKRGQAVQVTITGKVQKGFHTYPAVKLLPGQDEAQRSKVRAEGPAFASVWGVQGESEPKAVEEGNLKYNEFEGEFTWTVPVLVRPTAAPGPAELALKVKVQVCNESGCFDELHELSVPVVISGEAPLELDEETKQKLVEFDTGKKAPPVATGTFPWREIEVVGEDKVGVVQGDTEGILALVLAAVLAGFISLATPCVFPMIPITVSIFLKQSEAEGGSILIKAVAYCLTLVAVLTAGGIVLGSVLQAVAQHWATNLLLTAVFVFFGLSLLGAYDITLPSWLSDMTSSGEGRGGVSGVVFMALTFSVVSFACVGPIYGGFTALSATSGSDAERWTKQIVGPLAFSLAFASPFFVLALFPGLLKSMPRSGSWMNTVKVVMGFLELAAALKFLRAAEVNFFPRSTLFTFDLVLAMYVALALGCGLYLFGFYRLPHDHEAPEHIGVGRLVFGLVFVTLSLYYLPGIFKDDKGHAQKPRGVVFDWTRAFLLPDDESEWSANLQEAMARAEREKKLLFIDFTGFG